MVGVCAGLGWVSEAGQCPNHLELVLTWTLQPTLVTGPMLLSKPGLLHCRGLRLAQVWWPYQPTGGPHHVSISLTFPSSWDPSLSVLWIMAGPPSSLCLSDTFVFSPVAFSLGYLHVRLEHPEGHDLVAASHP